MLLSARGYQLNKSATFFAVERLSVDTSFGVVPAGNRNNNGDRFYNRGNNGLFWSSSVASGTNAWYRTFNNGNSQVERNNNNRSNGFSVRCVRDSIYSLLLS